MLIFTLGDPWSVNIELVQQCLTDEVRRRCQDRGIPLVCIGSHFHWTNQLGKTLADEKIKFFDEFISIDHEGDRKIPANQLDEVTRGHIAHRALEELKAYGGKAMAVLTMPIDKNAAWQAGFDFPGQTEFFENLWKTRGLMILAGPQLRVGLVTTHIPISKVADAINPEILQHKIELMMHGLEIDFGIKNPRLAVAGLNPHCGDKGMFGDEDRLVIRKTVEKLLPKYGDRLVGPLSADIVFHRAYHGEYDGVLAMYHDQGLGPLKTVHFDSAINLTAGLPHLRVSPDHGPASDLFGLKKASVKSSQLALEHCIQYLNRRN